MPHEVPPREDLQLFETQDLEIYVPPAHRDKPKPKQVPQEEALFDPGNVEPYPPSAEPEAEEPLSYYASMGVSAADEAKINKYQEQGNRSLPQILKDLGLAHLIGEAPSPPASARGSHAETKHIPRKKKTRVIKRTMFGDIGEGKKRGELEARADTERAALEAKKAEQKDAEGTGPNPTTENPPQ